MDKIGISGNKILITGGATGIGFAIAKAFHDLGNELLICGRRESKLQEAAVKLPGIKILKCDISKKEDRRMLYDFVDSEFGGINILVNNAGIQRPIDFRKGEEDLLSNGDEIEINLKAQISLAAHFIPILINRENSAIINISSGLGFVPLARFPIYSATKAAIHSFSMSLRKQLEGTNLKIFEVIPPTVYDTELKGKPLDKTDWMVSASEVSSAVIDGIRNGEYEIAIGPAKKWSKSSREELDKFFNDVNH